MSHWIVPGDWIIRSVLEPDEGSADGEQLMLRQTVGENRLGFGDHAIFVLDATKTHLTVHDPINGLPRILSLALYPGEWLLATKDQVDVTWVLAEHLREKESMMIRMERERLVFCQGPTHAGCQYEHRRVAREAIQRAALRNYRDEDDRQRGQRDRRSRDDDYPMKLE